MAMDFFVRKIADGMIFSVDWQGIREMSGEEKGRKQVCSLHPNTDVFPPAVLETASVSKEEITAILP